MSPKEILKTELKEAALQHGFVSVGVSEALPLPGPKESYRRWLKEGNHATMEYLERDIEKRFNPSLLFKGARSVISMAWSYGHAGMAKKNKTGIALYAWGEDYHFYLRDKAQPVINLLESKTPGSVNKFFTDSAFLSERSLAVRSGLGWIGKNGTLITENYGSMVLLAEIVTSIDIPPDEPYVQEHCGDCTRCLDACPTGALTGLRTLVASKCISYQTNTQKENIPHEIAIKLDGRIYGCDVCQQVCPWNILKTEPEIMKRSYADYPVGWPKTAADWLDKDKVWFGSHFKNTALEYKGFNKIQNNARSAVYGSCDSPQE